MISLLALVAGGVALGVSFLDPSYGGFVFLAFVPLFTHLQTSGIRAIYFQGLLLGLCAFCTANYWIYPFLNNLMDSALLAAVLAAAYFVFGAHAIALLFMMLRGLRQMLPMKVYLLLTPLVATVFFAAFPLVFNLNLAQTLVEFPLLIAPLSITGPSVLVALIVAINVLLAEWLIAFSWRSNEGLRKWPTQNTAAPQSVAFLPAAALLFLLWLGLGWKCSVNLNTAQRDDLRVGLIQTDDPPGESAHTAKPGFTLAFPPELAQAYALAEQGAKLIVWPESRPKGIVGNAWIAQSHQFHAQGMHADLMVQDLGLAESPDGFYINTSFMFSRDGKVAQYTKMTPIPFGEVIPASLQFEPAKSWVSRVFKGIYKPIVTGTETVLFSAGDHTILPLICYEIFNRKRIINTVKRHPEIDLLVLQSNDRWFFSRAQVVMHNAAAQLIAVETSRPVMHLVNGGPSFFINARGVVIAITDYRRAGAYLLDVELPQGPDF